MLQTELPENAVDSLVRAYLVHHGYGGTLAELDKAEAAGDPTGENQPDKIDDQTTTTPTPTPTPPNKMDITPTNDVVNEGESKSNQQERGEMFTTTPTTPPEPLVEAGLASLAVRTTLRSLIVAGKPLEAKTMIETSFPGLYQRNTRIQLEIAVQRFIELLRRGAPMDETVAFVRSELSRFRGDDTLGELQTTMLQVRGFTRSEGIDGWRGGVNRELVAGGVVVWTCV